MQRVFFNPAIRLQKRSLSTVLAEPIVQPGFDEDVNLVSSKRSIAAEYGSTRIGQVQLPRELIHAVEQQIADIDKTKLRNDALDLYAHLRLSSAVPKAGRSTRVLPQLNPSVCLAYAAGVMPSHYAATFAVLDQLRKRLGDRWSPQRIVDFGAGTASVAWASVLLWPDLEQYTGFDSSRPMQMLSSSLFKHLPVSLSRKLYQTDLSMTDFAASSFGLDESKCTIAISAYTLSEIKQLTKRRQFLRNFWQTDAEYMVLIDRGTPAGFDLISDARSQLLRLGRETGGAHVLAPCSHDKACPLRQSGRHCHFPQRLERPAFLRKTKHATIGEEDSKYSYVIIRRQPRLVNDAPPQVAPFSTDKLAQTNESETGRDAGDLALEQHSSLWPRLIAPPLKRSGHVVLDTCAPSGSIERLIIPKSQGKQAYKDARKSSWGDLWPHGAKNGAIVRTRGRSNVEQGDHGERLDAASAGLVELGRQLSKMQDNGTLVGEFHDEVDNEDSSNRLN